MATYVVGDVHGCFRTLKRLIEILPIDRKKDRLWLTGDLVNRGPSSRKVLHWAMDRQQQMGKRFQVVLGNHDLHLIAVFEGIQPPRRNDQLEDVLSSPDAAELVTWLTKRPLVVSRTRLLMVHAGLHPTWTIEHAENRGAKLKKLLSSRKNRQLLLGRKEPPGLRPGLARARTDLAILTRIRCCRRNGSLSTYAGPPAGAPRGCYPWHQLWLAAHPQPKAQVLYGHWAAQGLDVRDHTLGLDSGCAWGQRLTALRLDDRAVFSMPRQERLT